MSRQSSLVVQFQEQLEESRFLLAFLNLSIHSYLAKIALLVGKAANTDIQFKKRNPADPLATDELLTVSYAWSFELVIQAIVG